MARSYSTSSNASHGGGYGYGYGSRQYGHRRSDSDGTSLLDDLRAFVIRAARALWKWWNDRGRQMTIDYLLLSARRLRLNLVPHRVFSVPHLLVVVWLFVLLRGERWIFHSEVEKCRWEDWEKWVRMAPRVSVRRRS